MTAWIASELDSVQRGAHEIKGKGEMKKNSLKLTVMAALAAVIYLPGMAWADYVQTWVENGLYGNLPTLQTWNTAEAFLLSPVARTGTGLTINSGLNHLNGLCS